MTTYELIRGDDNQFVLIVTVPDEDEPRRRTLLTLTGYEVEIMAKEDIADGNDEAVFWVGTSDTAADYTTIVVREQTGDNIGKADVQIPSEATEALPDVPTELLFDVLVRLTATGDENTVMRGKFNVVPDINRYEAAP